jgi:hypothetical protein
MTEKYVLLSTRNQKFTPQQTLQDMMKLLVIYYGHVLNGMLMLHLVLGNSPIGQVLHGMVVMTIVGLVG